MKFGPPKIQGSDGLYERVKSGEEVWIMRFGDVSEEIGHFVMGERWLRSWRLLLRPNICNKLSSFISNRFHSLRAWPALQPLSFRTLAPG
jgi:hypothetical protein